MKLYAALSLLLVATLASADPYKEGSTLPRIELPDQHGAAHVIDESVRVVVFSRDMDAGQLVRDAVAKAGPDLFSRNGAVFVAKISGMPAVIRSLFALPAMRRRPYAILIDEEGTKTADFPGGATVSSVMVLDEVKVRSVAYPASAEALIALLEAPAR
ncbi:MAG TPA: hypothetical protein VMW19_04705 [Myxococcota bacterium]|nr:hypothetical protein [Myxococcota bacterium]